MSIHVVVTIELGDISGAEFGVFDDEMHKGGWKRIHGFASSYTRHFEPGTTEQKALLNARESVDNALFQADWNKVQVLCTVSQSEATVLTVDPWSDKDSPLPQG